MVKNIRGVDRVGKKHYVGSETHFRSATKVNVVVTEKGIPLSVQDGSKTPQASQHDASLTTRAINEINVSKIPKNSRF